MYIYIFIIVYYLKLKITLKIMILDFSKTYFNIKFYLKSKIYNIIIWNFKIIWLKAVKI